MKICRREHPYDDTRKQCPECLRVACRNWARRNPEKDRAAQKAWLDKNPGWETEWQRQHREKHPGLTSKYLRTYRERHPELVRERDRIRQHKKRSDGAEPFTAAQWQEVVEDYRGLCAYCGIVPWQDQDHVIPAIKGGPYALWNLVPACRLCNVKKGTKYWTPRKKHRYMRVAA